MKEIARFQIEDIFEMTGRGLVFTGRVIDGIISTGDQAEFQTENKVFKRKVKGVEGVRHSDPDKINIALLIECGGKEDVFKLISLKDIYCIIKIYK